MAQPRPWAVKLCGRDVRITDANGKIVCLLRSSNRDKFENAALIVRAVNGASKVTSVAHIAAALETASGKELNDAKLTDLNGTPMFTASFVDAAGGTVSIGFLIPADRQDQIIREIARTLEGR